jgi:hypothetical protein
VKSVGLLKKIGDAAFGTPEQRQEKQRLKRQSDQAYSEGKTKGTQEGARQRGYQEGKRQASGGGGFMGNIGASLDGLNRVEKAFGFDTMMGAQRPQPHASKRSRNVTVHIVTSQPGKAPRKKSQQRKRRDDDPFGVFG